jgi:hypothetical protein
MVRPMAEKGDKYNGGVSAGERETITRLTGCLADLNATPAAKRELAILRAVEVLDALAQHRNSPRGAQCTHR